MTEETEHEKRARLRANNRRYEEKNPEMVRNKKRHWFEKNPDYLKSYYARNRLKYLVQQAFRRAVAKRLPFWITEDDLVIPDVCPVLGIPIRADARGGFNPNSPSIDRIIPEFGYVLGNVRVISNRANLLKRDGTLEEFRAVVRYLEETSGAC